MRSKFPNRKHQRHTVALDFISRKETKQERTLSKVGMSLLQLVIALVAVFFGFWLASRREDNKPQTIISTATEDAEAAFRTKDFDGALDHYRNIVKSHDYHITDHYLYTMLWTVSESHVHKGNFDTAVRMLDALRSTLDRNNHPAKHFAILSRISQIYIMKFVMLPDDVFSGELRDSLRHQASIPLHISYDLVKADKFDKFNAFKFLVISELALYHLWWRNLSEVERLLEEAQIAAFTSEDKMILLLIQCGLHIAKGDYDAAHILLKSAKGNFESYSDETLRFLNYYYKWSCLLSDMAFEFRNGSDGYITVDISEIKDGTLKDDMIEAQIIGGPSLEEQLNAAVLSISNAKYTERNLGPQEDMIINSYRDEMKNLLKEANQYYTDHFATDNSHYMMLVNHRNPILAIGNHKARGMWRAFAQVNRIWVDDIPLLGYLKINHDLHFDVQLSSPYEGFNRDKKEK